MPVVVDYRVRRRLDFVAQYDINCSELEDGLTHSIFLSSAQLTAEIEELCSGGKVLSPFSDLFFNVYYIAVFNIQ